MSEKYPISEFFLSVQGEGVHSGRLALFLRFGECNLNCRFCDTKEQLNKYRYYSLRQTEKILIRHKTLTNYLVLTGGEPVLHDLSSLLDAARKHHYTTALETNGTLMKAWVEQINWVTVSPKPGSMVNPRILGQASELKFVITSPSDLAFAESYMPFSPAFLVPSRNSKKISDLIFSYLKRSRYKDCFKLGVQLHRVFGLK